MERDIDEYAAFWKSKVYSKLCKEQIWIQNALSEDWIDTNNIHLI